MAIPSRKAVVDFLREVLSAKSPVHIMGTEQTKETLYRIDGLLNENLISAIPRRDPDGSPNAFGNIKVTPTGKEFIDIYDSENSFKGIWRKYHPAIFKWAVGILTVLLLGVIAWLWNRWKPLG